MRVALFHASAGYGHTKVAEVIADGLVQAGVSEKEILVEDVLDETPVWFKSFYAGSYYYAVKHAPRIWGWAYELADQPAFYRILGQPLRRCTNRSIGQSLVEKVERERPNVIVSTHFMAPEILGAEKKAGRISSFLLTVVTDFYPHAFWVNPGTDHYWVMSDEGKAGLEKQGVSPEKITVGGIPVSPKFCLQGRKAEIRKREGLEEKRLTILITSGSFGLGPTEEILNALQEFGGRIQTMVVCGRNETLHQNLAKSHYPFQIKLYSFVTNMDELMEACDLVVAKPGGSTTSETLAKGVPMAVLAPIPGQEAGNARLLKERNASFFLGQPGDIRTIVKGILDYPEVLEEKRRSIGRLAKPHAVIDLARFILNVGE